MAKAVYGAGSDLAEQWVRKRYDELDRGKLSRLVKALRAHASTHEQARQCLHYVVRNRSRMRYPSDRPVKRCWPTLDRGIVGAFSWC